jgi:hypothetical protein
VVKMPVRIRRSNQFVDVTSSAAHRVLQVDPHRLTCNITNLGTARVSLIDNPSQPETSGYPIASGSFINYKLSDGDDVTGSFILRSVSGTNTVRIQESFREEF